MRLLTLYWLIFLLNQSYGYEHSEMFEDFIADVQDPFCDSLFNLVEVVNLTTELNATLREEEASDKNLTKSLNDDDYMESLNSTTDDVDDYPEATETELPMEDPDICPAVNTTCAFLTEAYVITESYHKNYSLLVQNLQAEIDKLATEISLQSKELELLKEEHSNLELQVKSLRENMRIQLREVNLARKDLRRDQQELRDENHQKNSHLVKVRSSLVGLDTISKGKDLNYTKHRIQTHQKKFHDAGHTLRSLYGRISSAKARINSVKLSLQEATAKRQELEPDLRTLTSEQKIVKEFLAKLEKPRTLICKVTTKVENYCETQILTTSLHRMEKMVHELRQILASNNKELTCPL